MLCPIQFLHVHASLRYKEVIVSRIASLLIIRFDRSRWTGWRGTLSSRSGQRCWKYLSLGYVWYTGDAKAHSNKLRESRWELSKESFMFNQRICWRLATFRFNNSSIHGDGIPKELKLISLHIITQNSLHAALILYAVNFHVVFLLWGYICFLSRHLTFFEKLPTVQLQSRLVERGGNVFDTEGFTGNAYSSGWLKNG